MPQPPDERIAALKSQFPDRSLHLVEALDGNEELAVFVMTGPTRDEYRKFLEETTKAQEIKDKVDSLLSLRSAVERAALAQIRWPDREEAKAIFERTPAMVDGFVEHIHKSYGANVEVRSKKL